MTLAAFNILIPSFFRMVSAIFPAGIFLFIAAVSATLAEEPVKKPRGIIFQVKAGYSPQVFGDFFQGTATDALMLDRIQNRIDQVNRDYTNLSNYGGKKIVSNFTYDNDVQYSLPVGFDIGYRIGYFSFETGLIYHLIAETNMSYDMTVGPQTVRFSDTSITAYADINENANLDNRVYKPAYGLYPTGGRSTRFYMHSAASRWEIPFTIFINIDTGTAYTYSLGAGIGYYTGTEERNIYAEALDQSDIDRFSASAIGYHFVFRARYKMFAQIHLLAETRFTFALSAPVKDSVITGTGTVDSIFHLNAASDFGGSEIPAETGKSTALAPIPGTGVERYESLNFTGISFFIGIGYVL